MNQWMYMPNGVVACATGILIAVLCGCKPEPNGQLTLRVNVMHADEAEAVEGFGLELKRRVLENGVLNGNYQWVGTDATDSDGQAEFVFDRVNALDYQLNTLETDWFERSDFIHPDDFIVSSEVNVTVGVTPRGTVHIQLVNAYPFNDMDRIEFRTLNVPGEYTTCSNAWESHVGMNVNVERICDVEADRYLPYRYRITRNDETTELLDSIFVERGSVTEILIAW